MNPVILRKNACCRWETIIVFRNNAQTNSTEKEVKIARKFFETQKAVKDQRSRIYVFVDHSADNEVMIQKELH